MTTLSKFLGLLISLILLLINASCSDSDDTDDFVEKPTKITNANELTAYYNELIENTEIPGFAVCVVKNGSILYQNAMGYADLEKKVAYTNTTTNSIASVSKTFVAAATAKAIEEGYFDLNTNINELLPVEIKNPNHPTEQIKIKHLLTHTSGLVDNIDFYIPFNYFILEGENVQTEGGKILTDILNIQQRSSISLESFLAEYFLEDGDLYSSSNFINAVPGSKWSYSNTGTALLGYIIETVTEQPFYSYVDHKILTPLAMTNSTYDKTKVDFDQIATSYFDKNTPLPRYANDSYPEGGLYTSSDDLSKYLIEMCNGLMGNGQKLFTQEYYDMIFSEQLNTGIVPNDFAENHGFFWYLKDGRWMHGGNDFGTSTHLEINEDGSWGYFILTNMDATLNNNAEKYEAVKKQITAGIQQLISN